MQKFGKELKLHNGMEVPISLGILSGDLAFVSGQLAMRDGKLVEGDIVSQTNTTLDNIAALLAEADLDLGNVVKATVWLAQPADFAAFNAAWGARFKAPYPARSTVVSGLLIPGALVEIEVIARRA